MNTWAMKNITRKIVQLYLHKLFKAEILYRCETRHRISFVGAVQPWEQQYLVSVHHGTRTAPGNVRNQS